MLTGDFRNQIDQVSDGFWSGGIWNRLEAMVQIAYLFFIRLHTLEDNKANRTKKPIKRRVFPKGRAFRAELWKQD